MYWRDVRRETIPMRVWLNPFRYELSIRAFNRVVCVNRYGAWARTVPAALRRLRAGA